MKVYKYRGLDFFKRDVETLMKNQIYASPFGKLNDPFEGIYDDQVSAMISFIEKIFKADGKEIRERLKIVTDYKPNLGIYSLSKCFMNELLWAHYANAHRGFCVEYELKGLKENYQIPPTVNELDVDYENSPQKVTPLDFDNQDLLLRKLFATKSEEWEYEDEIRLIFDTSGLKEYHPSTLTGIYFGIGMIKDDRELLIDSLTNLDVKFHEIYREKDSFKLKSRLVHENKRHLKYSLDDFNFEILKHIEECKIENFYVLFNDQNTCQEYLELFSIAFREKYEKKNSNIFLFHDKSAESLIGNHSRTEAEEEIYEKALMAHSFMGDDGYFLYKMQNEE